MVGVLAVACLLLTSAFSATAAQAYCSPVQVFESRGSGDSGISAPDDAFIRSLGSHYSPGLIAAASNPYAAVSILPSFNAGLKALADLSPSEAATQVRHALNGAGAATRLSGLHLGAYHDSVVEGRGLLKGLIADFHARCPTSSVFLVGYSQGAQVTADVISKDLNAGRRAGIAGVVLFGDPRYNNGSFAAVAQRSRHGLLGQRDEFPSDLRGRVLSFCHPDDPVCQGLGLNLAAQHHTYDRLGEPQQAADAFAARLDLASSPAFEIKLIDTKYGPDYHLGPYRTRGHFLPPSQGRPLTRLSDLQARFGKPSSCHSLGETASAVWKRFGLHVTLATLGAFTDAHGHLDAHGSGCKYPSQIFLAGLIATLPYWHTDLGLRIGDSQQRIGELYPAASELPPSVAGPGNWALHVKHVPYGGGVDLADLVALTDNGAVYWFILDVGGQGE